MKFAIIDTETGGKDPNFHELLELSVIEIDPDTLVTGASWSSGIAPKYINRIDKEALEVNGFTVEQVQDFPTVVQARGSFLHWWRDALDGELMTPVAHNWSFDKGFMRKFLTYQYDDIIAHGSVDTKSFFKTLNFINKDYGTNTSLRYLAEKIDIPHRAHESYSDCMAVLEILRHLRKENPSTTLIT